MNETDQVSTEDIERIIAGLMDMRPLFPLADKALEVMRWCLALLATQETFVLAPAESAGWWIGPKGLEVLRYPPRDLRGVEVVWLALNPDRAAPRTSDLATPGASYPDNAVRNQVKRVADWIASLDGCVPLAEAIRQGITVSHGSVYYEAARVLAPIEIVTS